LLPTGRVTIGRYAIDFSKVERELGWKPSVSFEEGIRLTVEWYETHREWWKKIKTGEYLDYYTGCIKTVKKDALREKKGFTLRMKRILVIGSKGMLGKDLMKVLPSLFPR